MMTLPTHTRLMPFDARPEITAVRDAQDLMSFPFFALGKSRRIEPIIFSQGQVHICVEGTLAHGIATIWDADILIWAASQIVTARDAGLQTSRLLRARPIDVLRFLERGRSLRDYQRLKAALDRLQSTTVATTIRASTQKRMHRFSWITEWKELGSPKGLPIGIELILSDWFYIGVLNQSLVLSLDRAYFRLSGGLERWLYRMVRKHAGYQTEGWQFLMPYLHLKSGSLSRYSDFVLDVRRIVSRQSLPGYHIRIDVAPESPLIFTCKRVNPSEDSRALSVDKSVDKL